MSTGACTAAAAVLVLLGLGTALPAAAQSAGQTGTGGAVPSLQAAEAALDELWQGPAGRLAKGLVGTAGLAAAARFGAMAAFGSIADDGVALASGGVSGDGTVTTTTSTTTTTATTTTATATSTQ